MKTIPFQILALIIVATGLASAQIPRTINYQGRASDAAGPLTGTRQFTLTLYDDATGGNALFTETQGVDFQAGGVFTVVIGAGSPEGIPDDIPFDVPYWLGVRIEGFNGGNELSPRYELRSAPYSFRSKHASLAAYADAAAFADRADSSDRSGIAETSAFADSSRRSFLADSTATIPRVLGDKSDKPRLAVLEIVDTGRSNGRALHLRGNRYALVTEGVDSTSEHYVAGGQAGPIAVPDRGGMYRDNVPVAWGVIAANGAILSDFGIAGVNFGTGQVYEIVLDNPAGSIPGATPATPAFSPQITIGGPTYDGFVIPRWSYKRLPSGSYDHAIIVVRFLDAQGFPATAPFSIVVYGR